MSRDGMRLSGLREQVCALRAELPANGLVAWIQTGGAHHTAYSYAVTAEIAGIELVVIDAGTRLRELKAELRHNDLYYGLAHGLRG